MVVGLVRNRWFHSGMLRKHSELLGSFGCAFGDRRIHPGSLGSMGCALGFVGFIRGRWVHWGAPWGSSRSSCVAGLLAERPGVARSIAGRWVHWGAPRGSSSSSRIAGFLGVRPGCRWVRLLSLKCALGVIEFICGRRVL